MNISALVKSSVLSLALLLAAIPASAEQVVKIGLTGAIYEDIWAPVAEVLAKEGVKLEYVQFSNFSLPNQALANGEVDLNAFQHHAFLRNEIKNNGYEITSIGDTFIIAMNLYSQKIKSVEELKDGDKVAVPNDVTNEGRALKLLEAAGVLKLKEGVGASPELSDIVSTRVKLEFVEIDANLIPILQETLAEYRNVTVLHQDILKTDIRAIARDWGGGRPLKVTANLPYYITTPIIMNLLEQDIPVDTITVMVQKEVADRMQVGPGTKDYGALSLAVQYYARAELVANVPPNCFMPRPGVGSAVIRLTKYQTPPVQPKDPDLMFRLIRASFNQRRKTLQNGLNNSPDVPCSREAIAAAIEKLGLPAAVRGETLSLQQFADLADCLSDT